ncbi:MAG TPA: hypothetical protein VK132_02120 [Gemmatimonadales bacterium]|nr:hypothetical protein [Gemmatimonadales bacterium]
MTGRPVRRRVLAEVEQAGGWPVVLARIASGESVVAIARTFGVSGNFFGWLLNQDPARRALAVEARCAARGRAVRRNAEGAVAGAVG